MIKLRIALGLALCLALDPVSATLAADTADGLVTEWLVCGPFPSKGMPAFYEDHLLELGGQVRVEPTEGMTVTNRGVAGGIDAWYGEAVWERLLTGEDGYVDLAAQYASITGKPKGYSQKVAYASCTVEAPQKQRVVLEVRTNKSLQVWVNHREVTYNRLFRGGWRQGGVDLIVVDLDRGANRILVKTGDFRYSRWGFTLRVLEARKSIHVDRDDALLPHLRVGEGLVGWASLSLVNTTSEPLDGVTVEVRENELFSRELTEVPRLEPEWNSRVAFRIRTKREVTLADSGKADLELVIRGKGEEHVLTLRPEVRSRDQYFTRTYRSEVDGSVQPYSLMVPPEYDGARPFPLMVVLHGAHVKDCISSYKPTDWTLIMTAYGRGNTGYREIGTNDVFAAMAAVQQDYNIDANRTYLAGHSMGGHGTWYLGTHFPDKWAALNPMSGYGDYRLGGYAGRHTPDWQVPLYVSRSAIFSIENALHLPTFVVHGAKDDDVMVEQARGMTAALEQLEYDFVYDEYPDKGHWWGMGFPNALAFLKEHVRDPAPREVILRTNRLQFNQSHWVRIDAIREVPELAKVHARILEDNRIQVETENVHGLTLFPDGGLIDLDKDVVVSVNGAESFRGRLSVDVGISLTRDARGGYRRAGDPAPGPAKTRSLFGPIIDAYSSPFIYVYGTSGTPADTEANRRAARQDALDWRTWANGRSTFKSDVEVSQEDIRTKNLILYGGPASNAIVARINDELPVRIEGDRAIVGEREFTGEDIAVKMIYPNPLNPQRYVLVNAGTGAQVIGSIHKLGDPLYDPLPDYVVYRRGDLERDRHHVLTAGFFDRDWQVSDR